MQDSEDSPATLKIVSLRDLLLRGDFGGVPQDIRPSDVVEILGEPSCQDELESGATILRFGSYELAFYGETPMYLMNDGLIFTNTRHFQNRRIKVDPWVFERPRPLTKAEVTKHLSIIGARYRDVIWNDREALQMDSGVLLDFGPDLDDKQIVCTAICLSFPEFPPRIRHFEG